MDPRHLLVWSGSLLLFLASAKAHGRQLRLEREKAGYMRVTFGGKNPAFVEGLWRQERRLFWSLTGAAAAFAFAYAIAVIRFGWHVALEDASGSAPWWLLPLGLAIWPMTLGFTLTGLISITRLWAALRSGTLPAAGWAAAAWRGTAGWWGLVATLGTVVLAALLR